MTVSISVLVLLFILSGILAAVESALFTVNLTKIKLTAENGDERALKLNKYLENQPKLVRCVKVIYTVLGFLAAFITVQTFLVPVEKYLLYNKISNSFSYVLSIAIILFLFSSLFVIFGKFVPRCFGIKNAENIIYKSMSWLKRVMFITSPFVFVLTYISNFIVRLCGIEPADIDSNVTREEIRMLVDAGGDTGTIDESEKEMINNIFEFDNTSAGDIATHRTDIVAVSIDVDITEIKNIISQEKFSRIPVYKENIDNIVGIFHIKNMIKYLLSDSYHMTKEGFNIKDVMMEPYFVPFSKKTDELFEEMQKNKVHMAIIIDEYGGTSGLVTMEDLLEEIVGNIFDESDEEEEEEIKALGNDIFIIKGTANFDDVLELLNMQNCKEDDDDYDYETLGGFLIGQLGRIPEKNESPEIKCGNITFKILKIIDKRIERVKVFINSEEQTGLCEES